MTSLLRQIVASPRARHAETGLDLCYITDNIIATSGPSSTFLRSTYRTPLSQLVSYLDRAHGTEWCIFEFRAEGTGYPDSEVYNRIQHFPWPDHHPPPYNLIPAIMSSMHAWLNPSPEGGSPSTSNDTNSDPKTKSPFKRVAVVHCKAGKGRSGTIAVSYLVTHLSFKLSDALARFTERRMRVGFGAGVSIPSQVRWVGYMERWASQGKKFVDRPVEVVEVQLEGAREGVRVEIRGYKQRELEGKKGWAIEVAHQFTRAEGILSTTTADLTPTPSLNATTTEPGTTTPRSTTTVDSSTTATLIPPTSTPVTSPTLLLLKPPSPIPLETSDISLSLSRRIQSPLTGWKIVTSVAHVWFNVWFEGGSEGLDSGVFEIEWAKLDGLKGSARKGGQCADRVRVVWRYADAKDTGAVEQVNVVNVEAKEEAKEEANAEVEAEAPSAEGAVKAGDAKADDSKAEDNKAEDAPESIRTGAPPEPRVGSVVKEKEKK